MTTFGQFGLGTALLATVALSSCGQTTGSRAVSGTAIGAAGGAAIGAIGGNAALGAAAGAGAGLLGGLIYDQNQKSKERAYNQGYQDAQRQ